MDMLRVGLMFFDAPNRFFKYVSSEYIHVFATIPYLHVIHVRYNIILRHHQRTYKHIVKATDFWNHTVCFKQLIMQPRPMIPFTWDGWYQDMPCTFKVPL